MAVNPVPVGWHSVTPRLFVTDVAGMVEFLRAAFDASGECRSGSPSEIRIGDSIVMVSDASAREARSAFLYLYLEDTDASFRRALVAGATALEPPQDMFYGDRRAMVKDPFGNIWQIATHQEDLSQEEIRQRAASQR